MFYTFYLDDVPKHRNRLLRLDNERMARAYVDHLHRDMHPRRQKHVRVSITRIDHKAGRAFTQDITLSEFEAGWMETTHSEGGEDGGGVRTDL